MANSALEMLGFYLVFYAFVGWAAEVVFFAFWEGKFINRGFLNLPLNLSCGVTAAILIAALPTLEHSILLQYLLSLIVFGTVHRFAERYVRNRRLVYRGSEIRRTQEILFVVQNGLIAGIFLTAYLVVHPMLMGIMLLVPAWAVRLAVAAAAVLIAADFLCVRFALHTRGAAERRRRTQSLGQWIEEGVWRRLAKAYPSAVRQDGYPVQMPVFAKGICKDKLFWVFLISSALGALIEMVYCRVTGGIWMSRSSVLYGAFSFVWGFGAVVLTVALERIAQHNGFSIFLAGFFIGGAYEYLCSVFTEVVFGTVFWDYSYMRGSIGGRTNVLYCVFWGLLALVWIKLLYPPMDRLIERIPPLSGKLVTWTLVLVMACNGLLTAGAMIRYRQRQYDKDSSGFGSAFFDRRYDDAWMEERWPNMVVVKEKETADGNSMAEKP